MRACWKLWELAGRKIDYTSIYKIRHGIVIQKRIQHDCSLNAYTVQKQISEEILNKNIYISFCYVSPHCLWQYYTPCITPVVVCNIPFLSVNSEVPICGKFRFEVSSVNKYMFCCLIGQNNNNSSIYGRRHHNLGDIV